MIFICVLISFSACKKQKDQPPPPANKEYKVITTATLYNPANGHYEAACWINETRVILDAGNADQCFPYGIEKKGEDIYISGGFAYSDPSTGSSLLMPCYWKNGQKINLPVDGLSISERCGASDLKWFNNALYIIGDADLAPVIWKVKDGHVTIIPVPWGNNTLDVRKTGNLQVYNNQLYIGGNQKRLHNGETVFTAGYWSVDQNDNVSFHIIEDNLSYALCFYLSVSDKGVFIAGEYSSTAISEARPVVWTSSGHLPVSNSFNPAYHRLHTCVVDEKGNIYLNVRDLQLYQPVLWKVPAAGAHQLIQPAVPPGAKGFCEAVDIDGDQLAYAYMYELNNQHYAAYIFNGKTVPLDIYNNKLSNINRMKLFHQ